MAKKMTELSKAEWVIMKRCWEAGKSTARQIYEASAGERDWEYQTVKTMLDRIAAKGYLKRESFGPLCLYDPCVAPKQAKTQAIDSFLTTVMDNTLAPLFAHLAHSRKLSREEVESLKDLIEQNEPGKPVSKAGNKKEKQA